MNTFSTSRGTVIARGIRIFDEQYSSDTRAHLIHHEWGHMSSDVVGIGHSGQVFCGIATITFFNGSCSDVLPVSVYDPMSSYAYSPLDYPTPLKKRMGWLKNSMMTTSQQGTFQMSADESADNGTLKMIQIPLRNPQTVGGFSYNRVYVELRKIPYQFGSSGVILYAETDQYTIAGLANGTNQDVVPLVVGRVYTLGTNNPSVRVDSIVGDVATVTIIPPPSIIPTLSALSPSSGPVELQVTLQGTGFTSTGNTVRIGGVTVNNLSAPSGTILFTVPSSLAAGVYPVSVANVNGTSNTVPFTVTTTPPPPPPPPSVSPTLSLISPKSGDTLTKGSTLNISWQCVTSCSGPLSYDIKLIACGSFACTPASMRIYFIAKNIPTTLYSWNVGRVIVQGDIVSSTVPDGAYRLQVCVAGSTTCDTSNTTLTLISNTAK